TTDEVTNDKENQVRKVTEVGTTAQELGNAKKAAKAAIDAEVNRVKEAIKNNDNLTPADQQRLEAEATQAAKDAKAAIDAKVAKDGVTDTQAAQVATVTAVGDKATALGNAKADAKAEIDRQAETAKQAITANPHLTAEDQNRLTAEVTKAVDAAKAAVDTHETPETVTQAKETGTQGIDAVEGRAATLGNMKADTKYVLDTKKRTAEINRDNNFANSRLIPLAKRLPNTGDNQSSSIMMELLLLLAGIIVFKKRKKED
ncbi:LPXTG cell wall anchor domain-containing protein, partial [Streptococcus pluranimalium]|uniref:LPXTG cell wall anchor domain-containing protein n=1 Tax=Streptococcus pluranimalium TaxID=82348 RepID=UPI0039FD8A36